MRLGKEEAVGYVEDTADETETATLTTEEITASQPWPLTETAEPALPVG